MSEGDVKTRSDNESGLARLLMKNDAGFIDI